VEKISSSDRAHFALGKESRQGNGAQFFSQDGGVVMGNSKESFSPSATTEQQGSKRFRGCGALGRGEQRMEIFIGGMSIPDLELNGLSFLDHVADDDGAGLLVGPE
jgi:hypothetical protein